MPDNSLRYYETVFIPSNTKISDQSSASKSLRKLQLYQQDATGLPSCTPPPLRMIAQLHHQRDWPPPFLPYLWTFLTYNVERYPLIPERSFNIGCSLPACLSSDPPSRRGLSDENCPPVSYKHALSHACVHTCVGGSYGFCPRGVDLERFTLGKLLLEQIFSVLNVGREGLP